jgi:RNA polymerase sigma-70 factor, ECF subfamily
MPSVPPIVVGLHDARKPLTLDLGRAVAQAADIEKRRLHTMVNTTTASQIRLESEHAITPLSAQAFRHLYEANRERLLNDMTALVRNRDKAEDITAAAFAAALQHLESFRRESSFYTWLYRIASNEACSLRRQQPASLQSIEGLAADPGECDKTQERLDRSECRARLCSALRGLPATHRRTLVDHFVRGYSVKQISRRERIPVGTVLSRIFTGKRLLREAWG